MKEEGNRKYIRFMFTLFTVIKNVDVIYCYV